jgi:hypothetical protein
MAYKGGLRKWFKEDWRDVATGKPCGRKSASKSKRKYPACRPKAVADRMSKGQKSAAVSKKRAAGNPGGKPTSIKWSVSPSGRKRKRVSKKR